MLSAVLLNWKRPENIPKIVQALSRTNLFSETIIWDNSGILPPIDGATVVNSDRNYGTYGRRLAVACCRNETIFTQDDDYLIENIPDILAAFAAKPDCIAAALSAGHHRVEAGKTPWLQIGWGSIQKREWMIDAVKPYIACYGVDGLLLSKYDRIYTVLHGKHNPLIARFTRLKDPDGTESDRNRHSLWLQKDHWKLRNEAVERALRIRDSLEPRAVGGMG